MENLRMDICGYEVRYWFLPRLEQDRLGIMNTPFPSDGQRFGCGKISSYQALERGECY